VRLFIAVNFDSGTLCRLSALQRRLAELGRGNFSREENLHLTLAFLGEVAVSRADAVRAAMDNTGFEPLTLVFERTGCFGRQGGSVFWVGIAKNPALFALQRELSANLAAEGFALESRRFEPHVTLAREFVPYGGEKLTFEPFSTRAEAMSLMVSERVGGRLRYREIYRKK
jgi:2'-5' RNA ligase